MTVKFNRGDLLIYKKQKQSNRPGPRARSVASAVQDGVFSYVVDKLWIVGTIGEDGTLEVHTRSGKCHQVAADDPNLRRVNWWQSIWYRSSYQELVEVITQK